MLCYVTQALDAPSSDRSDAATSLPPVPKPGEVVLVRGSLWAVTDVREQGLSRSPADDNLQRLDHIVTLQSIAEDRLGEEATFVWELELGHSIAPDQGLPDQITPNGFDDPSTLAAFVDALRWGAVTSADPKAFQAPFRSGANVEPYQLEPLRRALAQPRANLLLADDVGLGKTIEAGLVIQELLLRHRARSVMIVCPPSLSLKWQEEMLEKFGLDFTIVDSELMAQVRRRHGLDANPFKIFPRVIVSMAWLPGVRAQRLLRDVTSGLEHRTSARRYAFDVLVVDEAHHVAPSSPSRSRSSADYAVDSQRTIAVRELARLCEHRLFLSATPHNGHSESFTALMEMIDDRRFQRGASVDPTALQEVSVRRLKSDIVEKGFQPRRLGTIPFTPSADEEQAFGELDRILTQSADRNGRKRSGDIVSMLLKKRFLSSPWAFARTMSLYQEASAGNMGWDEVSEADEYYAEIFGSDQSDEEEGLLEQPESEALRQSKSTNPLSAATPAEIAHLCDWGSRYQARPDTRLRALMEWLRGIVRIGTHWSNERAVIFTEYADTLEWIRTNLEQQGYDQTRLGVIQGSTDKEERERIRARFTTDPTKEPIRVLLATDSAGEGIDLQDYCHRLVNFDIPFNPSRLEQRIGRIDRYGQKHTPEIFQLSQRGQRPSEREGIYGADLEFLQRIGEKVATAAADLGSMNLVVDAEIQNHFGRTAVEAPKPARDDTSVIINKALAGSRDVNRSLTVLAENFEARQEQLHLTPRNAERVLQTALRLTAQPPLEPDGEILSDLPEDAPLGDAEAFTVPDLGGDWSDATRSLATLLEPDTRRPITFDPAAARAVPDGALVHVHLGHPLLQKAGRTLRSALYDPRHDLHRVTAVSLGGIEQSAVAAVCRIVLVGRGGVRLHEEMFIAGISLRGRKMAAEGVERLLDVALDGDPALADEALRAQCAQLWNDGSSIRQRLQERVDSLAQKRRDDVRHDLETRREEDLRHAREIYAAFRRVLDESQELLRERQRQQREDQETTLFTMDDASSRQLQRDIDRMRERLAGLDAEESAELRSIEERYNDPRPFVTTAAIVFAVTPQDAQKGVLA
ncbi:DISARM system SNF2-like helicase DrmD [Brachybacterium halotolerans subsp. kimchii]|uniref:DISARM system SNF2-like helicase DrmD n=1 Tax=Brachybacterium halotolerans TaxID=2795215 RepID=UPI001E2B3344|nr:DISARM system SNF2-like helicase DrmD [Brachybacterium halotolerans]UEJ84570.1 DISARM system SNF2-like helicase DrmD [Brachybacterium halotolerans subsp. kimchii]